MSSVSAQPSVANLEALLFKATNPSNKVEDVNTIKRFCDAVVEALPEGAAVACRLIAHKIQSPQEREALQALAVLEACVKACGEDFHVEVGKFKFLNEMIKLVSPKYLGSRTPEHIKRKVIELLFVWSRELSAQSKIGEAYAMLKAQGLVRQDPDYVGQAVFAASLPPRRHESPLSAEQTSQLKALLASKNTEDLQKANKIIKGMMKEDERRFDSLSRRSTELTTANNNAKLLHEMLDHLDHDAAGGEELDLLRELFESCEKMQPKIFRLAAETEDGDEFIGEILQTSDNVSRAMDRYKMVVKLGRADVLREPHRPAAVAAPAAPSPPRGRQDPLEELLDLAPETGEPSLSTVGAAETAGNDGTVAAATEIHAKEVPSQDEDLLGLMSQLSTHSSDNNPLRSNGALSVAEEASALVLPSGEHATAAAPPLAASVNPPPSVDDLLTNGSPVSESASAALINTILSNTSAKAVGSGAALGQRKEDVKASRRRGLDELDLLGESAIKTHLSGTERSPLFEARRNERMPMGLLQERQRQAQQTALAHAFQPSSPVAAEAKAAPSPGTAKPRPPGAPVQVRETQPSLEKGAKPSHSKLDIPATPAAPEASADPTINAQTEQAEESRAQPEVKLSELNVPLSSIKPASTAPLTILGGDGDDASLSIVLHFGQSRPAPNVTAVVVTILNRTPEPLTGVELRCAVEPRSCRVRLQPASATQLPAHNPFVPPAAVTQVMLVANPARAPAVALKYVLSYRTPDGETLTEMGQVKQLPLS